MLTFDKLMIHNYFFSISSKIWIFNVYNKEVIFAFFKIYKYLFFNRLEGWELKSQYSDFEIACLLSKYNTL